MAECILLRVGGGGIDPDELTATPEDVIRGKTFGGYGSDEMQRGILTERPGSSVASKITAGATKLIFQMLPGAYRKAITDGYCEVYADYATIRPLVGYDNQNRVLEGATILGAPGKMPNLANQTIPRDGNTANVKRVENLFETSTGSGADVVIAIPNRGYFENTMITQAIYGIHPKVVRYGEVIGSNPTSGDGYLLGEFTGDADATEADIAKGKLAYAKGLPRLGTALVHKNQYQSVWSLGITTPLNNQTWLELGSFYPVNCSAAIYTIEIDSNFVTSAYLFAHIPFSNMKAIININTNTSEMFGASNTAEFPIEFSNNQTLGTGDIRGIILIKLEYLSNGKIYVYAKIRKPSSTASLEIAAQKLRVVQQGYFK